MALQRVVKDEEITWRSWWDRGRQGTIIRRWNVVGWPTTYVLDAQGVIKYKDVRGQGLDEAIDALISEIDEN